MTKEVLISITGMQFVPGTDYDTVELIAPGEYYFKNDKHYLLYEEIQEGFEEPSRNMVKVAPDYMELTKKGPTAVHMLFEKNKKNVTYYYTPFGNLLIGIDTKSVEIKETEEEIGVDVSYVLELNYEHVADCEIHMSIKSKGAGKLNLG